MQPFGIRFLIVAKAARGFAMDITRNEPDESDTPAGDLLIGAALIEAHLKQLGVHDPNAYYLRRVGKWPIGKYGANLVASRRRLNRHAEKITRGPTAA
jgi:hypothetical protein